MKMTQVVLARIGTDETVRYAVQELYSYLKKIDNSLFVDVRFYSEYDESVKNTIWVGQSDSFADKILDVPDKFLDDSIYINVENSSGIITGCNPRSVLIAAYRFLKELGVAWIRPSDDGEVVPEYEIKRLDAFVQEKASYRHRAICIEGAVSYEHVLEMLKWIPRAGMSGYYFQFLRPFTFFEKWYNHLGSEGYIESQNISRPEVDAIVKELESEIALRGLVYHKVGHGWTGEPLGFTSDGWYKVPSSEISEDIKPLISELDGERKFFRDIPLNTNLCYSNPKARKLMVDYIADYIRNNPHVHLLHFWLGDGSNNICECKNCTERVSDYFVMMLNELDDILTKEGNDTKIVFLLYGNTNWAPLKEKFNDSDRFVLMLAPIARNMSKTFKMIDTSKTYTHAPYEGNKTKPVQPGEVEEVYALLKEWQDVYSGDSFDYDYHLMWDHFYDPGYYGIAKTIYDDMQALETIGINGMMSCQLSRAAFPTNLPLHIMAETLWDKDCDFEEKALEYFVSAFGPDGEAVMEYMKALSENFDPYYNRQCFKTGVAPYGKEERLAKLKKARAILVAFEPVIKKNLETAHCAAVEASWKYLEVHAEYCQELLKPVVANANGNTEDRDKFVDEFDEYVKLLPTRVSKIFDEFWALFALPRTTRVNVKLDGDVEGAAF